MTFTKNSLKTLSSPHSPHLKTSICYTLEQTKICPIRSNLIKVMYELVSRNEMQTFEVHYLFIWTRVKTDSRILLRINYNRKCFGWCECLVCSLFICFWADKNNYIKIFKKVCKTYKLCTVFFYNKYGRM